MRRPRFLAVLSMALCVGLRQVRGDVTDQRSTFKPTGGGRWGIIDAVPAEVAPELAIKNGWTPISRDGSWHVSCLAIGPDFVLAVQARYPIPLGLEYGAGICSDVTRQLVSHAATG